MRYQDYQCELALHWTDGCQYCYQDDFQGHFPGCFLGAILTGGVWVSPASWE